MGIYVFLLSVSLATFCPTSSSAHSISSHPFPDFFQSCFLILVQRPVPGRTPGRSELKCRHLLPSVALPLQAQRMTGYELRAVPLVYPKHFLPFIVSITSSLWLTHFLCVCSLICKGEAIYTSSNIVTSIKWDQKIYENANFSYNSRMSSRYCNL